jgi:hypothetical protein
VGELDEPVERSEVAALFPGRESDHLNAGETGVSKK